MIDQARRAVFPTVAVRLAFLLSLAVGLTTATALGAAESDRVAELERKVDALTAEIEDLKLGPAADTARVLRMPTGLGRGASKVYGAQGVSIGGYGEMLYENFDRQREDETLSGATDRLDLLRHVLYLGYRFNDALLLDSEIEVEHAGVKDEAAVAIEPGEEEGEAELSGEVVAEFAFLDWTLRPGLGVRAGLLLVPVGLVNEMHEPTAFLGARRPDVEQRIIPTTWSANGVGVHGSLGDRLQYRAYMVEGLDAAHFSADRAIREGRQNGSQSLFARPSWTGRLDWVGVPGLVAGVSGFTGDSWQEPAQPVPGLDARVTLLEAHARYEGHGFQVNALVARGTLEDAGPLSDVLGLSGADRLGERFGGHYVEAGYDLLQAFAPGSRYRVVPYARIERVDSQEPGDDETFTEDPALRSHIVTAGVGLQPHPNVVFKLERQNRSTPAETGTSQWNAALGYVF